MDEILRLFPTELRQAIHLKVKGKWETLQEIRIRLNLPVELIFDDHAEWIEDAIPRVTDATFLINQLSEFSLYRLEDELREGYITIEGGHRVGIAGKVITLESRVKAIQNITFFNIRIAKEKIGVAETVLSQIYDKKYLNTLIIGPPQTGKTTLIRDLTRLISTGTGISSAKKVGVVDERSEIGASIKGVPQHNLGLRTDVLDACPKAEGMMMLIRSMSPEVMVVDEIGSQQDIDALMEVLNTGITILCSIHGGSIHELKRRPSLKPIFEQHIFERFIVLKRQTSMGRIWKIFDQDEKELYTKSRSVTNEVDWSTAFNRNGNISRI